MPIALPRILAASVVAALVVLMAPAARASVVPVDPGPVAKGRPIWGTTQNLPSMGSTASYTAGPQNAATIIDYYDSGQALRDQQAVAKAAKEWIYAWVDDKCGGKPESCKATVVFDVDETLLSNYGYYKTADFVFNQDGWIAFNEACANAAIGPSRDLYRKLKRDGFTLIVMTGRDEADRSWTAACLREKGITDWDKLILRSDAQADLSADVYKSQERAKLHRSGHRIVASIGDQVSDMSLGYLKAGFLLPNVMYYIP